MPMEGYVVAAEPLDACSPLVPPTFLTNFTVGKFVLINGTETCGFSKKVISAQKAGYDLAIIFDPFPMPFEFLRVVSYPKIEISIQVVFISFMDGITIKENYLYNNSYAYNFKLKIKPNTPDITYYMYLFGAVIGVCFFVMLLFMMCLLIKCIQERRRRRRNRLSSRQIKQIPTAKFTKGDQYDVCAICLEDYNEGDKLRILPCSHAYHTKCIDPWLMHNRRNCPLCKRKITFGDSGDDSDSDDSEMTSPAENTPLLSSRPGSSSAAYATMTRSDRVLRSGENTPLLAPERPASYSGTTTDPDDTPGIPAIHSLAVRRALQIHRQRVLQDLAIIFPSGSTNVASVAADGGQPFSDEEPLLPPVQLSINNTSSQNVESEQVTGNDLIV
ncbi:E3 ubiquitin-protein ligase RNF13 isoform X2 [Parasteatoda tepidariorum]|nr:E3 ubiquitin-protein ligase RNF13 isoform X2 [Parasteatoda tepidariorum]